jgi:hypothetical protein
MIQRLQTIWLISVALLSGFNCFGHICDFIDVSGNQFFISFSGIYKSTADTELLVEKTLPISILLILIIVLSVVCVMLFKKRKLQLNVSLAVIILAVCLACSIAWYSVIVLKTYNTEFLTGLKTIFPLLIIFFALLSFRGIKKDEDLVKSYDRLR